MTQKQDSNKTKDDTSELLRDLLIVELGLAGVPQQAIRKIAGCSMSRVNRIAKYLKAREGSAKRRRR